MALESDGVEPQTWLEVDQSCSRAPQMPRLVANPHHR